MPTKADKSDLGPIKDEMNKLKELLDELAKELGYLKASGAGNGDSGVRIDGDLIVKIDKLELKVDSLEKKLAGLA